MLDSHDPDQAQIGSYSPAAQSKTPRGGLAQLLSHLVFEAHGVRIGLELTACVLCYNLAAAVIDWQGLGVSAQWSALIAWFGSCFSVIVIDQLIFCRPVYRLRQAFLFALSGEYVQALGELEKISPSSTSLVCIPPQLYHLQRASILSNQGEYQAAETEFSFALERGAEPVQIYAGRAKAKWLQGEKELALATLDDAVDELGELPEIEFERTSLLLFERSDWWTHKQSYTQLQKCPDTPLPCGETLHEMSRAFGHVTQLWTGEAEEGLKGLSHAIDRLRAMVNYVENLRPLLTHLLLERAYYLATHREPSPAVIDVNFARSLCAFPLFDGLIENIREELSWRHQITLN